MINIIIQKLKEQKNGAIYYAAGLFAYTWLMIGLFPSMQSFDIDAYLQQMPEEFVKFFGGSERLQYSKIEGFLSMEYLSIFFVVIITFYLASSAGSVIAGGIEKRTIDFDLSQPISRTKYALSQFVVTLKYSAALVIFNIIAIYLLCLAYNINIKNTGLLAFGLTAILFMWALTGIAAFLSSVMKSKISVVLITVVIAFGSYVFLSLCNIIDQLADFKFISLYNLYNPQKLLESGQVEIKDIAILLAIFLVGTVASIIIFNKKDI